MKLIYRVTLRLSLAITLILSVWAVFFYFTMINEINDEMDDSLEDYSETIIIRALSGAQLPSLDNGSNNQYYLTPVSREYALSHEQITYADSMIYIEEKRETEPARILTTIFCNDDGQYFRLSVSTPSIEKADLKHSILVWMVVLYAALLLIILLVNVWVFYGSMKPLYQLLHWLEQYRIGQKNVPLESDTRINEFKKLYRAAQLHAERNEQLFEQQKRFIGNASHELQTPLAICRNRLEMLMEDEGINEKQLEELAKVHQTLEHITRLNKSLLLLSKIENAQFADVKDVSVNSLLHSYLEDYEEVYSYLHIQVEVQENATLTLHMNETLAATLITNLLKNAFVHNQDEGRIRILITGHSFIIANTGTPHALDESRIFERFYKDGKKEGSTGLGLSIADGICKMSGLSIHYAYTGGMHTFTVTRQSQENKNTLL